MKILRASSLIVLAIMAMSFRGLEDISNGTHQVNTSKSKVNWKGEKVTGEHSGLISIKSGDLIIQDGALKGGSFVIDMNSISVTDIDGEYQQKLEGHLKSDDFFGVEKFPISKFTITNVAKRADEGVYKVAGNLTIKKTTKQIEFEVLLKNNEGNFTATAAMIIDRADFDVRYGSGSFFDDMGDKMIYDDFTLNVDLTLN